MSDQKTIKIIFENEEKIVPLFKTYKECILSFQKNFNIDEEKFRRLSLFYYDEEKDQISFNAEDDYKLFIENENLPEKIIEAEISEKENPINQLEPLDPMRSGNIFIKKAPEQHVDLKLKNLDSSTSNLGNSLYSIDSMNQAQIFPSQNKKNSININNDNELLNNLSKMKTIVNKSLEDEEKENTIKIMKKQMEEMIRKHEEEIKRKEEENKKKYEEALAQRESEVKKIIEEKQLMEEKLKRENEMKEEMQSNLQIKQKEFEEMRSKIEIENQKKMKEIEERELETKKRMEEILRQEKEKSKKLEELKKLMKKN